MPSHLQYCVTPIFTISPVRNIVIYVVIAIIYPKPWSWADLSVIPALALIVLNAVWVSLCFGILATRYRDIGPLLSSIVQLLFFMTPIIWNDATLRQQSGDGGGSGGGVPIVWGALDVGEGAGEHLTARYLRRAGSDHGAVE